MKYLRISLIVSMLIISNLAEAKVYKCKDTNGKMTYKSQPCDGQSQKELKTRIKSENAEASSSKAGPAGRWVNQKNANMIASLSSGGSFMMTDSTGDRLQGNWSERDGAYKIDASFQGVDMGIKMRYNTEKDTLLLSKPGFANTMVRYSRRK